MEQRRRIRRPPTGRRLRTGAARRPGDGWQAPPPRQRVFDRRRARRRRRMGRRLLALGVFLLALAGVWRLSAWAAEGMQALLADAPSAPVSRPAESTPASAPAAESWELTLVNADHPLPADWQVQTVEVAGGERVDERILPALQQLFDAARAEGLYPVVASGWRTGEEQRQIMEDKVEAYRQEGYPEDLARQAAAQWVAQPGTSEHELGLAVDINPDRTQGTGQDLYDWLLEHAWEYGFIKRYPADKVDITGISNEPWHYRYVGQDAARAITEQGLCLEEYLGQA